MHDACAFHKGCDFGVPNIKVLYATWFWHESGRGGDSEGLRDQLDREELIILSSDVLECKEAPLH